MLSMLMASAVASALVVGSLANGPVTCTYSFRRDLSVGSTGADVAELQTALEEAGFLSNSVLTVKGTFDEATRLALAAYQDRRAISPARGVFGADSRALLGTRPTVGGSRAIDFRIMCSPSQFSFAGMFGHTDIAIEKIEGTTCLLRYGSESENPNWDGRLDHACAVPLRVWTFKFSDGVGIDLSPITPYCKRS